MDGNYSIDLLRIRFSPQISHLNPKKIIDTMPLVRCIGKPSCDELPDGLTKSQKSYYIISLYTGCQCINRSQTIYCLVVGSCTSNLLI